MIVGVTGTRFGTTSKQRVELNKIFDTMQIDELHHGDCIGVDSEVARMASSRGIKTICHPPTDNSHRAYHQSTECLPPRTHFARNREIVNSVDVLIVVPLEQVHQERGGTWYTHDYAVKKGVKIILILPQ